MFYIVITTFLRYIGKRHMCGRQQLTCILDTAFNYFVQTSNAEIPGINILKIAGADIQAFCHCRNSPVFCRRAVNFFAERKKVIIDGWIFFTIMRIGNSGNEGGSQVMQCLVPMP